MTNSTNARPQLFLETMGKGLPDRVATRIALGIVRHARHNAKIVRPADVTLADLSQCSAWDLLTVQGIGPKAWLFFSLELIRWDVQLRARRPEAELLVRSGIAVQELLDGDRLRTASRAKAEQFLSLASDLIYEIDARSDSNLKKF